MKILLRNPRREVALSGPRSVTALLVHLDINPESVLVIRNNELIPRDAALNDQDEIEIRPVTSGGAAP